MEVHVTNRQSDFTSKLILHNPMIFAIFFCLFCSFFFQSDNWYVLFSFLSMSVTIRKHFRSEGYRPGKENNTKETESKVKDKLSGKIDFTTCIAYYDLLRKDFMAKKTHIKVDWHSPRWVISSNPLILHLSYVQISFSAAEKVYRTLDVTLI